MGKVYDAVGAFEKFMQMPAGEGTTEKMVDKFSKEFLYHDPEIMRAWLMVAFKAGAESMAVDTLWALGDFATFVAGVNDENGVSSEYAFDKAEANLAFYYEDIFGSEIYSRWQ